MQVNSINNINTNPSFSASFKLYGTPKAKKIISDESLKAFTEQVNKMGKSSDYIAVQLDEYVRKDVLPPIDSIEEELSKCTNIVGIYRFEETGNITCSGNIARVCGTVQERSDKTCKLIEHFINYVASTLKK